MTPFSNRQLMPRRRVAAALVALPVTLWLGTSRALAQNSNPPGILGQRAPQPRADFWIDAQGEPTRFTLAAHNGKWVHLKFWQSWCPGCHAHGFPALVKMASAFASEPRVVNVALQTVFEGFSSNSASRVRQTQLRYRLPIVFGHDAGNSRHGDGSGTMGLYRSGGTPWHVIVNPEGKVVYNGFGLDADSAIAAIRQQLART